VLVVVDVVPATTVVDGRTVLVVVDVVLATTVVAVPVAYATTRRGRDAAVPKSEL
jgi:hypothetical protein